MSKPKCISGQCPRDKGAARKQVETLQFFLAQWKFLEALILNGLQQQHHAHGDITPNDNGSALKRIRGCIKSSRNALLHHLEKDD